MLGLARTEEERAGHAHAKELVGRIYSRKGARGREAGKPQTRQGGGGRASGSGREAQRAGLVVACAREDNEGKAEVLFVGNVTDKDDRWGV